MRVITDMFAWANENVPDWNTISISGYHMREAGSTAVQEVAFTLGNGMAYVEAAIKAGLDVDKFAPRLSFFFNAHSNFLEEVAKFRAARRMWARIMREHFKAKSPRSWMLRFHTQTAGSTLTAQQPENNIVRTAIQAHGGRAGRDAVAAHQLLRRSARSAHRAGGAHRAAHAAGHRLRVRRSANHRSRWPDRITSSRSPTKSRSAPPNIWARSKFSAECSRQSSAASCSRKFKMPPTNTSRQWIEQRSDRGRRESLRSRRRKADPDSAHRSGAGTEADGARPRAAGKARCRPMEGGALRRGRCRALGRQYHAANLGRGRSLRHRGRNFRCHAPRVRRVQGSGGDLVRIPVASCEHDQEQHVIGEAGPRCKTQIAYEALLTDNVPRCRRLRLQAVDTFPQDGDERS